MAKRRGKVEFRYYEMPEKELVLALLGEDWIRPYGEGIDYLHFHNFMEIGLCHFGKGEIVLDEHHCPFDAGQIVIIPPDLPHTTNSDPGTVAFWEWMYFDIDSLLQEIYPQDVMSRDKVRSLLYEQPFCVTAEEQPVLDQILCMVVGESQEKQYLHRESIEGLLRLFAVEVLRMRKDEEEINRKKRQTMVIAPAITYVKEHYPENIRIAVLADVCSISESHFRRIFLESMNMKPLDFVNLIRIRRACELIKKTDGAMESIAYQTGFENVSTFNRNFKRVMGMTPYQWKKSADNYEGKLLNYRISAQKGW